MINCSYNSKNNFYELFITCFAQIGPNLLKFGKSNISNMRNSLLMSKTIFMKYLSPVRPKLKFRPNTEFIEIWHI